MAHILIVFNKRDLKPVGGPTGYLYNFYKELEAEGIHKVSFLDGNNKKKTGGLRGIYLKLPQRIRTPIQIKINCRKYKRALLQKSQRMGINLNRFSVVHFHSTWTMYLYREELKQYKGIIVLTSHTPVVPYKEIIDEIIPQKEYQRNKESYDSLEKIDFYAFSKADLIVFPCKEAEEPYYHTWDKYSEIRKKKECRYLLTGTPDCRKKLMETADTRKKYGIPPDAFVISYVGRHNRIKGYDILKDIGERILKDMENVYFLVAGMEQPICGLKNSHWIEVGWTDEPYAVIEASDLFVLPNRETYFDLILLEVLSIGKSVLMSYSGGNKKFAEFDSKGIIFFHDIEEAVNQIKYVLGKEKGERLQMGKYNRQIYEKYFTMQEFTKNYLEIMDDIVKSSKVESGVE